MKNLIALFLAMTLVIIGANGQNKDLDLAKAYFKQGKYKEAVVFFEYGFSGDCDC